MANSEIFFLNNVASWVLFFFQNKIWLVQNFFSFIMWRVGSILSTKKRREKSLLSLAIPHLFFLGRQDAKILNLGKKFKLKN